MSSATRTAAFVGRAPEIARLTGFLDEAMSGAGRSCFVTGDPGAGKSSLLSEFIRLARERHPDLVVALGDCNPQTGTGDAYLPFREIMTALTAAEESGSATPARPARDAPVFAFAARLLMEHGPDLVDLFVPGAALVAKVGGEAANRLRKRREATPGSAARGGGVLGQAQLMEQYTNVIQALAARQPLMLVVDDLHWADEASISLLFHLSRRISGHRVLLTGAFRANEIAAGRGGTRHPLEAPLNELRRYQGDIEVDLPAEQEETCRRFVDELLDAEANVLGAAFRDELFRRTGGHALFTVELLHHLREQGYLKRNAEGAWSAAKDLAWEGLPARVGGVIRERAARLEQAQTELLAAASVLGESFDAETLAAVADRGPREVARDLSGPLSRQHALVRARGIRHLAGHRLAEYEFRHNLVHAYFYDSLDEVERSMLHEAAAQALEAIFGADCVEIAVTLGRHYSLAEIPGRAAHYLLESGRAARRAFAHGEARVHFERALDMLDRAESMQAEEPAWISANRGEALTQLGEVLLMRGDFEAARSCFEAAMEQLREEVLAGVRLLSRIAVSHERQHDHPAALAVLDQALEMLAASGIGGQPEGRSVWLTIQVQRLWLYYWQGDIDGMERTIAETESVLEQHGDLEQKQRFYGGKAALGNRRDRFLPGAATVEAAEQTLAVCLANDSIHEQAEGLFGSAFIFMLAEQYERARAQMENALELTVRCGNRTLEARILTYLAILHRRLGDRARAAEFVERAAPLSAELEMHEYMAAALGCRSWLAWLDADSETATALAIRALEDWRAHAPRYPFKWLALAQLLDLAVAGGNGIGQALEQARALLQPGIAWLSGGVSEALQAAVEAGEAGQGDKARDLLGDAVLKCRTAGYL